MKGHLQLLRALLLWSLAVPAMAELGQPVNLITNGDFESGDRGWRLDRGQSIVAGQGRNGTAGLVAEITKPNAHWTLSRDFKMSARNLYRFSAWARATKRTKLVLWIHRTRDRGQRRLIMNWDKLPNQWRQCVAPFSVPADGEYTLEIIAPSSHGAPPGKIWLDDISLHEVAFPGSTNVSRREGFNDQPAMAVDGAGNVFVSWVSYRHGFDTLQCAAYRLQGEGFAEQGRWQLVGGQGTYLLDPTVVGGPRGVVVLYAAEIKGNWEVMAQRVNMRGASPPLNISRSPAVDVKPAGAADKDRIWVAWESNRDGVRQVYVSSVSDETVSDPVRTSRSDAPCNQPAIAVTSSGAVWTAWHSFSQHNYDIYYAVRPGNDGWQPPRRLTRSPAVDRHAVLAADGDAMWVVYEHALVGKDYRIGATGVRRLMVARLNGRRAETPVDYERSPLYQRSEGGRALVDPDGRLWVTGLRNRGKLGWDLYLVGLLGDRWWGPRQLRADKGLDRAASIALVGDRIVIAHQADAMPRRWDTEKQSEDSHSDIYLAAVDIGDAPAPSPPALEPMREPDDPFDAAALHVQFGEDRSTPEIDYNGRRLKLFYGDLHEHTDVSPCNKTGDQSIDESYQHMRDISALDFACATDHGYSINPYLWNYTAKLARAYDDQGSFLTFLAEEWTSTFEKYTPEHPYGFYGHHNLILADSYFPRYFNAFNGQTPAEVWAELRKMKANFVHIPHQLADTGNVPTDWNFTDETAQPVAEIYQTRGSYEYDGTPRQAKRTTPGGRYFIQDAWARGIVIGVIASPDHGGGRGKACVFAPDLTRESVLDAIRARHTYGTTAAKIFLDVRVNGHLMGEKAPAADGKPVLVTVYAEGAGDIDRVEVCRNNEYIYRKDGTGKVVDFTFRDDHPQAGTSYYYVRVMQKDQEIAWSSPVFLGYE